MNERYRVVVGCSLNKFNDNSNNYTHPGPSDLKIDSLTLSYRVVDFNHIQSVLAERATFFIF